jgi:hypothetical protein
MSLLASVRLSMQSFDPGEYYDPTGLSVPKPDVELQPGQEWRWDAVNRQWVIHVEGALELTGDGSE